MPSIVRGPARASLLAAVVVVGLSLAGSESALSAYVPPGFKPAEFSSVAGKSTAYSATLAKGNCMNFGDVEVFWGDGKSDSEGSVVQVTETSATVTFSGTHEYTAAGDFLGTVNFTATCINNLGKSYHVFQKGTPGGYPMGFIVHVAPGASFPPAKTAPKKAVPQPVKDYFKAKAAQLRADAAFFCGEFLATGKPTPASAVAYAAFLPYCTAVAYRLGYYESIVVDPPDSAHAGVVAFPPRIALPRAIKARCKSSGCAAAVRAAARFAGAGVRVASVTRAMSASVDRFAGAGKLLASAGATRVGGMRVLQAAVFRAWAGELARALRAQHTTGRKLAAALHRAHISISTTDADARKQATRLANLTGIPKSVLAALKRNGLTRGSLRSLFARTAPRARGTSLSAILSRPEPTAQLTKLSHSLTPVDVAYIEDALHAAHRITGPRHAKLRKDLLKAAAARGKARRTALSRFRSDAVGVKGATGSLLRLTAGEAR